MTGPTRCICEAMSTTDYNVDPTPGCPVHDPRPPGEPAAEVVAELVTDVLVLDGPDRGSVWSYEAAHGGYLRVDPRGREADPTICDDIGALLVHTRAEVVRPLPRRSDR